MNTAIIYHWWNDSVKNVKDDLFNPIIFAIASVRYFEKHIPIYVIDLCDKAVNWDEFPEKLNFTVVKKQKRFLYHQNYDENSMSRIWDISETMDLIPSQNIIFNDADVFWIKPPLPLLNSLEKFNCNRNNGVFYFSKVADKPKEFIRLWKERNERIMCDLSFRSQFLERVKFPLEFRIHDELVVRTIEEDHPELYDPIRLEENSIVFTPIGNRCKNIHLIRAFAGKDDRLSAMLSIREIKEIATSVLGEEFNNESFPLSELITKKAIKHICSFGGDYKRAIDYGASKLC